MAGDPQLDTETFGDLLRRHRVAANLTQEALAERAGLSARGISDLERGARSHPYRETLRMLVSALGLSGEERAAFLRAARGPARPLGVADPRVIGSSLPTPMNGMIGRTRELATVNALLIDDAIRIVTLTGPGGVGKTRLALAAAEAAAGFFPDGVVFVDLAPVREPELLPDVIAVALGQDGPGAVPAPDFLRNALRGQRLLLLLDNFEHLLEAAPIAAELVRASDTVKALVTSREPLRLRGEWVLAVPPLELPPVDAGNDNAEGIPSESVRLFVLRATESRGDFRLTKDNAVAVASICRELDGLPLAIELAAPRVTVLPLPLLLERLEQRLPLLTGGARDGPVRQRSLRDAIAWSYDLLSPPEQALFRQLSVFTGGWTLEAAEQVVIAESPLGVLPGLASLVDKSLIRQEHAPSESRFSMLETIREFAGERLRSAPQEDQLVRAAHRRFYLALAETAQGGLVGPDQAEWLSRLDADDVNIRAALTWCMQTGEADAAIAAARALWRYWSSRGRLREGRGWLERALALPNADEVDGTLRGDAHNALGNLLGDSGEFTLALRHYDQALALRRAAGDPVAIAAVLNNLGLIAAWLGDYPRAVALHAESLGIRQESADRFSVAQSLTNLGDVRLAEGDFGAAAALHAEALALRDELRDASGSAYSRYNLGETARMRGDPVEAERLLEDSLRRFEALGDRIGIAYAEWSLGALAANRGDAERAAELLASSFRIRSEIGDQRGVIECLEAVALAAVASGEIADGRRLVEITARLRRSLACPLPPAYAAAQALVLAIAESGNDMSAPARVGDAIPDVEMAHQLAWNLLDRLGIEPRTGSAG